MNDSSGLPLSILNLGPNMLGYQSSPFPNEGRLNITPFAQLPLNWASLQNAEFQTNFSNQNREFSVVDSSNQTFWPIDEIQEISTRSLGVELPPFCDPQKGGKTKRKSSKKLFTTQEVDKTKKMRSMLLTSDRPSYEIIVNSLHCAMTQKIQPESSPEFVEALNGFVNALNKRLWDSLYRCNGFSTPDSFQKFENITLFFTGQIETDYGWNYFVSMCKHMDALYKEDKIAFSSFIERSGVWKINANMTDLMWITLIKRNTTLFKKCRISHDEELFFKGQDLNSQNQRRDVLSPDYHPDTLNRIFPEERPPYATQCSMQIAIEKSFMRPELGIYFGVRAEDQGILAQLAQTIQDPILRDFYSQRIYEIDLPKEDLILSSSNPPPSTNNLPKRHFQALGPNRKRQSKKAKRKAPKQPVKELTHEEIFASLHQQMKANKLSSSLNNPFLNNLSTSLWDALVENDGLAMSEQQMTLQAITYFCLNRINADEGVKIYFVSMYDYMEGLYKKDKTAYSRFIELSDLQQIRDHITDLMRVTFIKRNTTLVARYPMVPIEAQFFQGKDLNSENQIRDVLSPDYHPDTLQYISYEETSTYANQYNTQIKVEQGFVQHYLRNKLVINYLAENEEDAERLKQEALRIKNRSLRKFYSEHISKKSEFRYLLGKRIS